MHLKNRTIQIETKSSNSPSKICQLQSVLPLKTIGWNIPLKLIGTDDIRDGRSWLTLTIHKKSVVDIDFAKRTNRGCRRRTQVCIIKRYSMNISNRIARWNARRCAIKRSVNAIRSRMRWAIRVNAICSWRSDETNLGVVCFDPFEMYCAGTNWIRLKSERSYLIYLLTLKTMVRRQTNKIT